MSQPAKRSKKTETKSKKQSPVSNGMRDLIVRLAVFGILGLLLLSAVPEFLSGRAATATADAWRAARAAKPETEELLKSEFDKIPIQGSPLVTTGEAGPNSFQAVKATTYTWKGTFRTHVVKVYFGMGQDPAVEEIEGPGSKK